MRVAWLGGTDLTTRRKARKDYDRDLIRSLSKLDQSRLPPAQPAPAECIQAFQTQRRNNRGMAGKASLPARFRLPLSSTAANAQRLTSRKSPRKPLPPPPRYARCPCHCRQPNTPAIQAP